MQLDGAVLRDRDLQVVGRVDGVLLDPTSLDARWLHVRTEDGASVLVPAASASEYESGELLVPYTRGQIAQAATDDAGRQLGADDAARLRRHYGFAD